MPEETSIQYLRDLRFAAGLCEEDLQKLADISKLVTFQENATIFSEGAPAPELFLICNGRVELSIHLPARGSLPILTLERGELLGWSSALATGELTATAVAMTPTLAIRIASVDLQQLCDQDHDIGYEIMRRIAVSLSKRLVATRLQVLDLFAAPENG